MFFNLLKIQGEFIALKFMFSAGLQEKLRNISNMLKEVYNIIFYNQEMIVNN